MFIHCSFVYVLASFLRCAMCGTLLYGDPQLNTSSCSNKRFGPPIDRDGNKLLQPDGSHQKGKQPPCLLRPVFCAILPCSFTILGGFITSKKRFSPSLFAREAPAMFTHNENTNCLRLVDGMSAPWLKDCKDGSCQGSSTAETWTFCSGFFALASESASSDQSIARMQ